MRDACGVFDVSHMGEIETSGPQARPAAAAPALQRPREARRRRALSTRVLCREDGGVLDDLFTYRLAPDRYLTVTNAANHDKDLAWFPGHAGGFDVEVADAHERLRDARRAGPARARDRPGDRPTASCPARMHHGDAQAGGRSDARLRHRLHGRGRRRAALRPRATRRRCGTRCSRRGAAPVGLGRARHAAPRGLLPPLRQRPDAGARPDRGRPGLVLQGGDGLHRRRRRRAPSARPARASKLVAVHARRRRHRAPGQPGRRRRRRDERDAVARASTSASAWPTCPRTARSPGNELEIDVRGKVRAAVVATKPLYRKENDG